ncbi:hypothetical protein WG66_007414 [Moniliophthora roreri]|nr:hypothetical protein WG66_007414 [Moniliophthora roreri]
MNTALAPDLGHRCQIPPCWPWIFMCYVKYGELSQDNLCFRLAKKSYSALLLAQTIRVSRTALRSVACTVTTERG